MKAQNFIAWKDRIDPEDMMEDYDRKAWLGTATGQSWPIQHEEGVTMHDIIRENDHDPKSQLVFVLPITRKSPANSLEVPRTVKRRKSGEGFAITTREDEDIKATKQKKKSSNIKATKLELEVEDTKPEVKKEIGTRKIFKNKVQRKQSASVLKLPIKQEGKEIEVGDGAGINVEDSEAGNMVDQLLGLKPLLREPNVRVASQSTKGQKKDRD